MYPEERTDTTWLVLILLLLALLVCLLLMMCASLAGIGYLIIREARQSPPPAALTTPCPQGVTPLVTPVGRPLPSPTPTPFPEDVRRGRVTVEQATRAVIPTRDLRVLGMRFHPELGEVPPTVNPTPPTYKVGDRKEFWVSNVDDNRHFRITAVLRHVTPHAYFWVEEGVSVDQTRLEEAARVFEEQIYPTTRRVFGEEWQPGVDNDPHITFLHARDLGFTVAGYFSSADSFPRSVSPYSNEMDMFYINLDATRPGDPFYLDVIAHEFQHMIQWYQDRNEETWLNEGLSVLSEVINGFGLPGHVNVYLNDPDVQLTGWSDEKPTPYYGAAGLFTYYLYERFGEEAIRRISRHPENGLRSVEAALREMGYDVTALDVFADWAVTNTLNDPTLEGGRFAYCKQVQAKAGTADVVSELPALVQGSVAQYGLDVIRLAVESPVTVYFQGDRYNRLAALKPHGGEHVMWGNRSDDSDMRLYTEVDLTKARTATLSFWTWYDIEELWDFAYVVISTDGGQHWQMLETPNMTRENPYGNNLGVGYTGRSGGGPTPEWIQEEIDLTPFVGQKILVGFEYVTDDAFTRPGFFVDDVCITTDAPDTSFCDGFEDPSERWVQEGFIRTDTFVPQDYLVQLVQVQGQRVRLERYKAVGGDMVTFTVDPSLGEPIILVTAVAPLTWERAPYTLSVRAK